MKRGTLPIKRINLFWQKIKLSIHQPMINKQLATDLLFIAQLSTVY